MPKAIWNGIVLAESDKTEMVEGNRYFPSDSINQEYFKKVTPIQSVPGKGWPVTTLFKLMVRKIEMLPGIILRPNLPLRILAAM